MATPKPDFAFEEILWAQGCHFVCGVDEVGRGPLAGPVVAAAVVLRPGAPLDGLHDSKQLTAAQRETLEPLLYQWGWVGLGQAEVAEIDTLNIRRAALLAMSRAVAALPHGVDHLLVDGKDTPPDLPCPATTVIGGDRRSLSIAAASVIAKVARDRLMTQLAVAFPGYGWEHNSGYPTPRHLQGLQHLGITPHHRRSFAPVRRLLVVP